MRLIKRVEINYLRSLYSATLERVAPLNVVFGRNDSGKSNVLRALNLFFNEMTEPDNDFDFVVDMSDDRKREAREVKGRQFIWIKITFDVPLNYRQSLGSEITVKRQWNRDEEWNQTIFPNLETPQSAEEMVAAVLKLGGVNPAAPSLFLFDDDRAGRGAYRKLCSSAPQGAPSKWGSSLFAWVLPRTDEFNLFTKRRSILAEQVFFPFEFLFPGSEAAAICLELSDQSMHNEIEEWRGGIHDTYFRSLKQATCISLATATPGTVDWFYARGVPNSIKGQFLDRMEQIDGGAKAIDPIAKEVAQVLLA